ncbi:MAG TPA: shikimate kinase [Acidimicrobiales bacterium]|nr:shikimate kinase [Acidimicrobiales bacterium]
MARLVLVGLPGVGKSTLARTLADAWNCAVLDTDDLVAAKVNAPVAQYLREHGEAAFRLRELDALREALSADAVVATGAGVVVTSEARALLLRAPTLWLDSDDETLLGRVGDAERPLLGADHRQGLATLRTQREAWYRSSARLRVDSSGTVDEVARRIQEEVESVTP